MKKLFLTACAITCAVSVFAQGTVQFNNRIAGSIQSHVYLGGTAQLSGNGANDLPVGTTSWTGFTALAGAGYMAALAVNYSGTGVPTVWGDKTTTFRTGGAAGYINGVDASLPGVAVGGAAKVQIFAWDAATATTPAAAWTAWTEGKIAAGLSKVVNINAGGNDGVNPPITAPQLVGLESFNIYTVPEPSTMALVGLGAAAMLIFRRRK